MALSDADVQKQIKHMMAFIEQEANEKAEEIDAKAEEEFNIEKGRLVQQQRLKIMEFYDKKEKQVELQKKIQSSNMLNQARLKVLKVREDHVSKLLEETRSKLALIPSDNKVYSELLTKLIVQALFQLVEPEVVIKAKQNEVELVDTLLCKAQAEYMAVLKKDIILKLDKENFLPANTCGGVELAARGRIKIVNTLESRMELIALKLIPEIRNALFGRNPNRKFFD